VTGYNDNVNSPGGKPYLRRWQIANGTVRTRSVEVRVEPAYMDKYAALRVDLQTLVQIF
jgi:hypothetical protein